MGGFSGDLFEQVGKRANYKCEVCDKDLRRDKPTDVARHVAHSATTFHLDGGPHSYVLTSPPASMKRFKGKRFPGSMFAISLWGFTDDAFCVCPDCHRDIHKEALEQTKIKFPDYKGRSAMWSILEWITLKKVFRWN